MYTDLYSEVRPYTVYMYLYIMCMVRHMWITQKKIMTTPSEPDFNGAIFAWSKYYSLTSS